MNKKIFIGLLSTLCIFALVGCGGNNTSDNLSNSSTTSNNISDKFEGLTEEEYFNKYYKLPDGWKDEQLHCAISGDLIDVSVEKALIMGCSYRFGYSLSVVNANSTTVSSSNENVFKVEKNSEGSCVVTPIHEGEAYFTLMDDNQLVRYRQKVIVKNPLSYDDMLEYLSNVEYWDPKIGEQITMNFLFDNEVILTGYATSGSGNSNVSYVATYEFKEETIDEYRFSFTDEVSKQHSWTGFNVSKCGDFMYLMSSYGVDAILRPNGL